MSDLNELTERVDDLGLKWRRVMRPDFVPPCPISEEGWIGIGLMNESEMEMELLNGWLQRFDRDEVYITDHLLGLVVFTSRDWFVTTSHRSVWFQQERHAKAFVEAAAQIPKRSHVIEIGGTAPHPLIAERLTGLNYAIHHTFNSAINCSFLVVQDCTQIDDIKVCAALTRTGI